MKTLTNWTELFYESLSLFGARFMGALPGVIWAIAILLLGWLFARLISSAVSKILKALKFDTLADRLKAVEFLSRANVKIAPSAIIGKFVYWILLLLVFTTASETMGWNAVSKEISKLITYLPTLLSAIVIFFIGIYFATFVRDLIHGATASLKISSGRIVGTFVFYLLVILVTLTALDQGGIDTTIITSNLLIILGSILGAAAISYGLASRHLLSNILAGFASRKTFKKGQVIEVDGVKGTIVDITNISVILDTGAEKVVVPTHDLISNQVKIF